MFGIFAAPTGTLSFGESGRGGVICLNQGFGSSGVTGLSSREFSSFLETAEKDGKSTFVSSVLLVLA